MKFDANQMYSLTSQPQHVLLRKKTIKTTIIFLNLIVDVTSLSLGEIIIIIIVATKYEVK